MTARVKNLEAYLEELSGSKEGKPEQVKDALEIYIGLWQKAIEKGIANVTDDMGSALEKIEKMGGL